MNSLVELADSDTKLLSLVSYVQRHELPVNQNLAENFMNSCKTAPGRSSATKMLHVAALSDDAELYQSAVLNALDLSGAIGHLTEISPQPVARYMTGRRVLDTVCPKSRSSGAGFLLKRTLSPARAAN